MQTLEQDEAAGGIYRDPASFRDPAGYVVHRGGQILRVLSPSAADVFTRLSARGAIAALERAGHLIQSTVVEDGTGLEGTVDGADPALILRHPRIPFVSYPYEWPFHLLRKAAVAHLDAHLTALEHGATLSDSSAFNLQFFGTKPVFIDVLSLVDYVEGSYWAGYGQFCDHFLAPLLLSSRLGLDPTPWYRGAMEGIPIADVVSVLPLRANLDPRVMLHATLHARMIRKARQSPPSAQRSVARRPLPKSAQIGMLKGLRRWIAGMVPKGLRDTTWRHYESQNSYAPDEVARKHAVVAEFCKASRPAMVFDFGCNAGEYAVVCLAAGAEKVVGFDSDLGALEAGAKRSEEQSLEFLPLRMDLANPSPNQGWAQVERRGLAERGPADAVLGLALLHHLSIGRNIALPSAIDWLMSSGPVGVIEFVPKTDPMVQRMLANRADVFSSYDEAVFIREVEQRGRIVRRETVSASGRVLIVYDRS